MSKNSEESLEDYYRYFAKWEQSYPGGIPLAVIEEAVAAEEPESAPQGFFDPQFSLAPSEVVFVAAGSSGRLHLQEQEIELLRKALQKGLQWDPSEAAALLVVADTGEGHDLEKLTGDIADLKDHWWVILGDVPEEALAKLPTKNVVRTVSLAKVLESPQQKKRFWNDIKKLLA